MGGGQRRLRGAVQEQRLILALLACAPGDSLTLVADGEVATALQSTVDHLPWEGVSLNGDGSPRVDVRTDGEGAGCFWVEESHDGWIVHGGDVLGAQYGAAAVLEGLGFRFLHPFDTYAPGELDLAGVETGVTHCPAMARRGLHLHTLHPIEALAALWEDEDPERAEQMFDWIVHNGGNYVQWVALEDILSGDATAWQSRTAHLVDEAHARGLGVGIGVQLFGSSNLQLAFDLSDGGVVDDQEMRDRLALLSDGIDWDLYSLSFGEFSGEDPDTFIDATDRAVAAMEDTRPEAQVAATIHVGNLPGLQVDYDGQTMLYYFLVQYCDPRIIPWVHTVMYYDLYQTAGGAYGHDDFSDHRQFLQDRLAAGLPVGYHPETAYWVAFDDSVPQYLPLYLKSRAIDDVRTTGLDDEVVFSSGWEWGYWQNDRAVLRMAYDGGGDWDRTLADMYAPFGDDGTALVSAVEALVTEQERALLAEGLTPWMASRDSIMDVGRDMGILSQPDRPSVDEVHAYDSATAATFRATVIEPLATHATNVAAIAATVPSGGVWLDEVRDGMLVDAARARFAAAIWEATLPDGDASAFDDADAALADAQAVMDSHVWHDDDTRFRDEDWDNTTIYDYGYLAHAQDLCFWQRERALARNVVLGEDNADPGCAL